MASTEHPDYVFDSFALLVYLQKESGGDQVKALLNAARRKETRLWLSVVNFAEVLYIAERREGLEKARQTVAIVDDLPLQVVEVDSLLAYSAAHIKAQNAISLADAFAVALAREKNARVVTGDPEFEKVAKDISIEWLPRKAPRIP